MSLREAENAQPLPLNRNLVDYLAGYFDASGSISVDKSFSKTHNSYGYTLRVDLQRTSTQPISMIRQTFPGYDRTVTLPSQKVAEGWRVKGNMAKTFMLTVGPNFRLKYGHWQVAREFIETAGNRPMEDSEELKIQMEEMNQAPRPNFRLGFTDPYVTGLFDAHGDININMRDVDKRHSSPGTPELMIDFELNHQALMARLGKHLNTHEFPAYVRGEIASYCLVLTQSRAAQALSRFQPYSLRYQKLIPPALDYYKLWDKHHGPVGYMQDHPEIGQAVEQFKQLKQANN